MRARRLLVVAVLCLTFLLTGCWNLTVPQGAAPLRYRDQVFSGVTVTEGIPYGAVDETGQNLVLDMYRPTGDTVTKRPAIVWVHGGGFIAGDRKSAEIVDEARYFAREGYVSVSIDYRLLFYGCDFHPLTPECSAAIDAGQFDAQAAIRFLRKNATRYGIDATRIAIAGSSAGAITALNVAYRSSNPGDRGNPGYPSNVQAGVSLSGAYFRAVFDPTSAPTLMFHNTADPYVSYHLAKATFDHAKAAGVTTFMTTWDEFGHVPYDAHRQQILDETTNFLYIALTLSSAAR